MELSKRVLICKLPGCNFQSFSASKYTAHIEVHSLDRNFQFRCPLCHFKSSTRRGLETHICRNHGMKQSASDEPLAAVPTQPQTFKCAVPACETLVSTVQLLKQHLKDHIQEGTSVQCPFGKCASSGGKKNWVTSFNSVANFMKHLSRFHRNTSLPAVPPHHTSKVQVVEGHISTQHEDFTPIDADNTTTFEETGDSGDDEEICRDSDLVNLIAKFYLKLEGHLLLPASAVQVISEDLTCLLERSRKIMKKKLVSAMMGEGLKADIAEKIAHVALISDPLYKVHHKRMGQLALNTEHLRLRYYKDNFQFREPEKTTLSNEDGSAALDASKKVKTIQTVKVRPTLEGMLEDPSVQKYVDKSFDNLSEPHSSQSEGRKMYCDYTDGKVFENHPASKQKSIRLMVFQDGFGITNPVGAAKNKHKTIGAYLTLANLPPEKRSKVDVIKLVALIPESHLKSSDPNIKRKNHHIVWKPIIDQLKDLEVNGIVYKGECLPVYLLFILGDNLGSHQLGGFTEYFGGEYWCRYCDMRSEDFHKTPHLVNHLRTPEQYKQHAEEALTLKNVTQFKGVKFDSIFNECRGYHVCSPGLPPCIAHDLFEGIVAHDMPLMIQHFISGKWFTRETLNRKITALKLLGMDASDKPAFMELNMKKQIKDKLSGNAVQNWNFLRFLPIILGQEKIRNVNDSVWQLYLKLKHICELLCAPSISHTDVLGLNPLLSEYVHERQSCFPHVALRPKHHFMMHYAHLILLFGPLIRLFTLRMESKHPIFKRAARMCQNFIDVYHTMAVKHQLREAYQNTGPLVSDEVSYTLAAASACPIYEENVAVYIQETLKLPPGSFSVQSVVLNGIMYESSLSWLLVRKEEERLVVGQICSMFCINEDDVIFLLNLYSTTIRPNDYGLHDVSMTDYRGVTHISNVKDLESYYPLPLYDFGGKLCLTFKYWPADN